MITKSNDLVHDENASTLSLLLIVVILAVVCVGAYLVYDFIVVNDAASGAGESIGNSIWGFLSGGVSAFFGGAWSDGKSIGNKWNPVNTWRNSSNRSDGKWWTFW